MAAARAVSNAARSGLPAVRWVLRSTSVVRRPCAAARARPLAVATSAMTTAMSALICPDLHACAMASMLLPAPEINTARRMRRGSVVDDDTGISGADLADEGGLFALRLQQLQCLRDMGLRHHDHHADAAVEGAVH